MLWTLSGDNRVVAQEIAPGTAADHAQLRSGDLLEWIDQEQIRSPKQVSDILHASEIGHTHVYGIKRSTAELKVPVVLQRAPRPYVAACTSRSPSVGILAACLVGASVRLRRPNDPATLHFFWLTVAFFGALAFTPSGRFDRLDYFF